MCYQVSDEISRDVEYFFSCSLNNLELLAELSAALDPPTAKSRDFNSHSSHQQSSPFIDSYLASFRI